MKQHCECRSAKPTPFVSACSVNARTKGVGVALFSLTAIFSFFDTSASITLPPRWDVSYLCAGFSAYCSYFRTIFLLFKPHFQQPLHRLDPIRYTLPLAGSYQLFGLLLTHLQLFMILLPTGLYARHPGETQQSSLLQISPQLDCGFNPSPHSLLVSH